MDRIAWICFVLCLFVAMAFIVATTGELPAQVASHFGAQNAPNGWMSRDGYLVFMLAFGLGLPFAVAVLIGILPRAFPRVVNLPDRDYWLAPARRAETLAALGARAAWLGCLLAVFVAAIHYVILEANRASPARLPAELFVALMAAFVAGLALWIGSFWLRFRARR